MARPGPLPHPPPPSRFPRLRQPPGSPGGGPVSIESASLVCSFPEATDGLCLRFLQGNKHLVVGTKCVGPVGRRRRSSECPTCGWPKVGPQHAPALLPAFTQYVFTEARFAPCEGYCRSVPNAAQIGRLLRQRSFLCVVAGAWRTHKEVCLVHRTVSGPMAASAKLSAGIPAGAPVAALPSPPVGLPRGGTLDIYSVTTTARVESAQARAGASGSKHLSFAGERSVPRHPRHRNGIGEDRSPSNIFFSQNKPN